MTDLSPETLRQLLRYEPDTGKLFWLHRPRDMFPDHASFRSWNSRLHEREAFTHTMPCGHKQGAVFNRLYLAHRVIWAMQMGEWPSAEVDHIDCNGANNAWSNLRAATRSENVHNTRRRSDNKSGVKGLFWDRARGKWRARINVDGREVNLGRFSCFAKAVLRMREARKNMHGQFARN